MNKFTKNRIALAVSAALALGAIGAANAAAPIVRATKGTLLAGAPTNADKISLLSTVGLINTAITLDVTLTTAVAGTSTGATCVSAGDNVNGTVNVNGGPVIVGTTCTLVAGKFVTTGSVGVITVTVARLLAEPFALFATIITLLRLLPVGGVV